MLTDKEKYTIIIHRENGLSIRNIAKLMEIDKKTVLRWIKRYDETETVNRKPGLDRVLK